MNELREMLVQQLKDAHSAERQAIQCMKRSLRKTSDPELKGGIEAHIDQSEEQRERVEQVLERLNAKAGRKICEAMRGLVEEAQHEMEEYEKGPILDLAIVGAQQRIEHYEIAAYGTMAELSKALGQTEVAETLAEILEEEKAQDEKLTNVTRSAILPSALAGADEENEKADDEGAGSGRKKSGAGSGRRR